MPERRRLIQPTSSENRPAKITDMHDCRDHIHGQQLHHPDCRVGANSEERCVTKGEVTSQPEQDVEADGEDPEDHETLHQVRIAGVELRQAPSQRGRG